MVGTFGLIDHPMDGVLARYSYIADAVARITPRFCCGLHLLGGFDAEDLKSLF